MASKPKAPTLQKAARRTRGAWSSMLRSKIFAPSDPTTLMPSSPKTWTADSLTCSSVSSVALVHSKLQPPASMIAWPVKPTIVLAAEHRTVLSESSFLKIFVSLGITTSSACSQTELPTWWLQARRAWRALFLTWTSASSSTKPATTFRIREATSSSPWFSQVASRSTACPRT